MELVSVGRTNFFELLGENVKITLQALNLRTTHWKLGFWERENALSEYVTKINA